MTRMYHTDLISLFRCKTSLRRPMFERIIAVSRRFAGYQLAYGINEASSLMLDLIGKPFASLG